MTRFAPVAALLGLALLAALPARAAGRNAVVFIADGLRYDSVTPETAPTMSMIRKKGVDFTNSHSHYPTLTTANASVIATGHYVGDTGNYANTLYAAFPVACKKGEPTVVAFVEDDCVLRAMKAHYGEGYIGQTTLAEAAHAKGYNTVIVGKKGPAAIQWLGALDSKNETLGDPFGLFIDETTNRPANPDGTPTMSTTLGGDIAKLFEKAGGAPMPPTTVVPNLPQQAYMISGITQGLIPILKKDGKPFLLVYWSRDPDITQHGATDSMGSLIPGINSVDGRAAIRNADANLKSILDVLERENILGNTDVFVTADHGFSTISHNLPKPNGSMEPQSYDVGFVAQNIASWLGGQKVFDPDNDNKEVSFVADSRPKHGSALIGPSPDAPAAIVAGNGGTDFIYVPDGANKADTAKVIVARLTEQPWIGSIFVSDALMSAHTNEFPGVLSMKLLRMEGAGKTPRPDIVIAFRNFVVKGCTFGTLMCAAEMVDNDLATGQGMHGSFSRADTRNFMAAVGPDFKAGFADPMPVSNADITPTLAHLLDLTLAGPGELKGRVAHEALKGGPAPAKPMSRTVASAKAPSGFQTVLRLQEADGVPYFDVAGMPGRVVGLEGLAATAKSAVRPKPHPKAKPAD